MQRELPGASALPARADRREPQPAQPRGQALPGHPGVHRARTRASASCSRPRPTTRPTWTSRTSSGCSSPRTRTSASGRSGCSARWARRSSSVATSARSRHSAAFEKSEHADDWRELMRLYLVRRTRSFIKDNYAKLDDADRTQVPDVRGRHALVLPRAHAADRQVSRSTTSDPQDQYARLFADDVVRRRSTICTCRATAWATTLQPTPARAANDRRGRESGRPVAGRQAADGLLPHQPVQAAGEQRPGVHPVGRAAHPAELRLPARASRTTCRSPDRHAGRGAARHRSQRSRTRTCLIR